MPMCCGPQLPKERQALLDYLLESQHGALRQLGVFRHGGRPDPLLQSSRLPRQRPISRTVTASLPISLRTLGTRRINLMRWAVASLLDRVLDDPAVHVKGADHHLGRKEVAAGLQRPTTAASAATQRL